MKKLFIVLLLIPIVILAYWGYDYFALFKKSPLDDNGAIIISPEKQNDSVPEKSQASVEIEIEEFTSNLFVPWDMAFTSKDRMLITERNGKLRQIVYGVLDPNPVYEFENVSIQSEEGLMGMALDPEYSINKYIYFCYAYERSGSLFDRVVRFEDSGNTLGDETLIIDNIPAAKFHAGCRVRFGPDGKLYITTGDATNKNIAQDKNSLGGKILRINPDGSIPEDNPFESSPIYTLGHRNPQGIDWDSVSGLLFSTEHGPSGFDGPAGGDEINLIEKGNNYGWPLISHDQTKDGYMSPLIQFTPAIAPGSGKFYESNVIPQYKNHFLVGALVGEGMIDINLTSNRREIASYQKIPEVEYGRIRTIIEGPDGYIYFSTSNRDGRGTVRLNDDKIYRIIPKK